MGCTVKIFTAFPFRGSQSPGRTILFAHDAERRRFFYRSPSVLRIKPRGDEFRQLEIVSADISARRPGDLHVNPLAFCADEFELILGGRFEKHPGSFLTLPDHPPP